MEPYTFTNHGFTFTAGPDDVFRDQYGQPANGRFVGRELLRVVAEHWRVEDELGALKLRIGDADRLADEVAALVTRRVLDSRSAAADALLNYRETPRTERSDRIAALEAEVERLKGLEWSARQSLTAIAALEAENSRLRANHAELAEIAATLEVEHDRLRIEAQQLHDDAAALAAAVELDNALAKEEPSE